MTADEYKAAKKRSRISTDVWLSVFRITVDQDKAYSSGRTPIPAQVEKRVDDVLRLLMEGATELEADLRKALPECSISLDPASLDVSIAFPAAKVATLTMCGVDTLNHAQVYDLDGSGVSAATFVRMRRPKWKQDDENRPRRWFLWRGDFHGRQNYWNDLAGDLLRQALRRYGPAV